MDEQQAQPTPGVPAPDTTPPGGELPVPEGETPVEDQQDLLDEQKVADSDAPEDVPNSGAIDPAERSPDQVPPDGDNSQAELKEAPADGDEQSQP